MLKTIIQCPLTSFFPRLSLQPVFTKIVDNLRHFLPNLFPLSLLIGSSVVYPNLHFIKLFSISIPEFEQS